MSNRVCFDARDVDRMVLTMPQAVITEEIRQADTVLSGLGPDDTGAMFYWEDRKAALELALDISIASDYPLVTPFDELTQLRERIFRKLPTRITPLKKQGVNLA